MKTQHKFQKGDIVGHFNNGLIIIIKIKGITTYNYEFTYLYVKFPLQEESLILKGHNSTGNIEEWDKTGVVLGELGLILYGQTSI